MSTAVVILNAIARDEYERDWCGFDRPFEFIEGDGMERGPVDEFSAEVDLLAPGPRGGLGRDAATPESH